MFKKKRPEQTEMKKQSSRDRGDIKAFLGPGSKFEGKLSFDELVRLDGIFAGEINSSDTLIVGETAEIEGSIQVGALVLSGRFKGDIKASISVELRAPAKVEGTIETPSIQIEEKVLFNGQITMVIPEVPLINKNSKKSVNSDQKTG
jgi:cytoskeletal protein CcmA (bactofilin family)